MQLHCRVFRVLTHIQASALINWYYFCCTVKSSPIKKPPTESSLHKTLGRPLAPLCQSFYILLFASSSSHSASVFPSLSRSVIRYQVAFCQSVMHISLLLSLMKHIPSSLTPWCIIIHIHSTPCLATRVQSFALPLFIQCILYLTLDLCNELVFVHIN